LIFRPISKPGYQFAEGKVDFKEPEKGPFEGPGRSILRHQRGVNLRPRKVDFKAPEWIDFEALERV
jgi:hypothetical protein